MEPPPVCAVPPGSGEACRKIFEILPEERTKVYDVRKIVAAITDSESCFELKERYGRSIATVLARLDGRSVGFIANNPMFKGGALDADACQKVTSFMVLCDSFNIPIVFLVDVPGFHIRHIEHMRHDHITRVAKNEVRDKFRRGGAADRLRTCKQMRGGDIPRAQRIEPSQSLFGRVLPSAFAFVLGVKGMQPSCIGRDS